MDNSDNNDRILLTVGWFRSGTTHFYEILKNSLPSWTHYYEPFNPMIADFYRRYRQLQEENPGKDVKLEIKTHHKILFQEYFEKGEIINKHYRNHFGGANFFIGKNAKFTEMENYLEKLAADRPAHFQLNRAFGRIGFLNRLFPGADLLVLIRDPRATWASWHNQPEDPFSDHLPGDKYQIKRMLEELNSIMNPREKENWGFNRAADKPPLANFLVMWSFLYSQVISGAQKFNRQVIVKFEQLVDNPEILLENVAKQLNLPAEITEIPSTYRTPSRKWRQNASPADYKDFLQDLPKNCPLVHLLKQFDYWD